MNEEEDKSDFKLDFKLVVEKRQEFHDFIMDNRLRILKSKNSNVSLNKYEMINDIDKDPIIKVLEFGKIKNNEPNNFNMGYAQNGVASTYSYVPQHICNIPSTYAYTGAVLSPTGDINFLANKFHINFKDRINKIIYVKAVSLNDKIEDKDIKIDNISYIGFNVEVNTKELEYEIAYIVADNDFELKWEKTPSFWINYLYSKSYMEHLDNEFYFYPEEFKVKDMKSRNSNKLHKKFDINQMFKDKDKKEKQNV